MRFLLTLLLLYSLWTTISATNKMKKPQNSYSAHEQCIRNRKEKGSELKRMYCQAHLELLEAKSQLAQQAQQAQCNSQLNLWLNEITALRLQLVNNCALGSSSGNLISAS